MIIDNRDQLLAAGNIRGRKLALDIIDRAMERVDAARLTHRLVRVEGDTLRVGELSYDLVQMGAIYVLGAGKGVIQIAEALEQTLGSRIAQGLVVEKRLGEGMARARERIRGLRQIEVLQGGHPVPDEVGLQGARRMIEIARQAKEGDLVFFCGQGGCSSLTTLPAEGLTLQDLQATTEALLACGADIHDISTVRMAITQLKSGGLAPCVHPAEVVNLIVNDYVWAFPAGWQQEEGCEGWGPCVPVPEPWRARATTVAEVLRRTGAWERIPEAVRQVALRGDTSTYVQTIGDYRRQGIRWHTFVLADPQTGAEAAAEAARELGLDTAILSSAVEGEAAEVGIVYAAIGKEMVKNGRPLRPPCAAVFAGETTVTLSDDHGVGGRNQECALSAALQIQGSEDIVIVSVGTDGTDGPTDFAGGIVDGTTVQRARERGFDVRQQLRRHNAAPVLTRTGSAIRFNQPGNNLCDLALVVVAG